MTVVTTWKVFFGKPCKHNAVKLEYLIPYCLEHSFHNLAFSRPDFNPNFMIRRPINELHQFLGIGIGIQKNVLNNLISPDIFLNINKDALTIILTNLISNSNRFSKNGEISIRYQLAESCHLISVSDTGVGMDIQLMEQINQRNLQITNRNSITHKSYGIGYNLIFKMLEVLNADLVVFRNQPFGTVVQISIPSTPEVG